MKEGSGSILFLFFIDIFIEITYSHIDENEKIFFMAMKQFIKLLPSHKMKITY